MSNENLIAFWFRRDLRLDDNRGLYHALSSGKRVLAVFIFDTDILEDLPQNDPRVNFIHEQCKILDQSLKDAGASLLIKKGKPLQIWKEILDEYPVSEIYLNHDYEPYSRDRDDQVSSLCSQKNIGFRSFKDQVIFEKDEIMKDDGTPYTVFTPYSKKWLRKFQPSDAKPCEPEINGTVFFQKHFDFPSLETLGLQSSGINVRQPNYSAITDYDQFRNIPAEDKGTYLGIHLRFGTVSIRKTVTKAARENKTLLSELIWREFFMQILYHFPRVIDTSFREKYDKVKWLNDPDEFVRWKNGNTGYPMVDAGMRQLNETGYMHNRVRMVTASFLCKHLLIDWRWGEAYFAEKLLDYELSSNNGNWQWAAGTGCDAAPYFRVFNPESQQKKFDPEFKYIRKWVKEFEKPEYPDPMVEHKFARNRALKTYKQALD
ncbi:MAG: deoxyribodipyrimidine photo-lyase [bacterium]|jgi:deoxyribodipyrimidine photo-lyase